MSQIKNIVLAGGSVKVIAYAGFLKAIEQLDKNIIDLKEIKRVAGTSGGAIAALLLCLGYDSQNAADIIQKFDFKKVLDDPVNGKATNAKFLHSVEKHEAGHSAFLSKVPVKPVKIPLLHREINQFGLYQGDYLRDWIDEIICTRIKKITSGRFDGKNLTFKELHELSLLYPNIFRDLYVVGVNVNTGKKTIFNHENQNVDNVIIADAIRISMSIPFLFKPHHVYYKVDGKRVVDAKRHLWVDGGWFDNYPIRIFDDIKYCSTPTNHPVNSIYFNPETIGCQLVSSAQKNYFEGIDTEAPEKDINNIVNFGLALFKGSLAKQKDDHDLIPEDKARTIYINNLGISMLAFNLSEQQQLALKASGQQSTEIYFTGKSDVVIPSLHSNNQTESQQVMNFV